MSIDLWIGTVACAPGLAIGEPFLLKETVNGQRASRMMSRL
jgi:hypothetical protein